MKKTFVFIGFLTAIFSIYLMLILANQSVYICDSTVYDFSLGKQIELINLEKYAKECNVSVQLRNVFNSNFGNIDYEVEVINPNSAIKMGKQKSLFPTQSKFVKTGERLKERYTRYFIVQDDDSNKIDKLKKILMDEGIDVDIITSQPVSFDWRLIFEPYNIGFFVSMFCLAFFSTIIFYFSRLKEIGILKLNGWSNYRISYRLLNNILKSTARVFIIITFGFSIYIITMDISQLHSFLSISFSLFFLLCCVYVLVANVAIVFINHINQIDSIKNKKNDKVMYWLLMSFKVILAVIVFVISVRMINNITKLNYGIRNAKEINSYDWYVLDQHISLTEKDSEELEEYMSQFDDSQIYNYCSSENKVELNEKNEFDGKVESIGKNMLIVSRNMLSLLKLDYGKEKLDDQHEYVLIPDNLWDRLEEIVEYEGIQDFVPIKIPANQWIMDFDVPGKYSCNSVVLVTKLEKKPYLGYADVFLSAHVKNKLEEKLRNMGYENSDVELKSLRRDNNIFISNYELELFENTFYSLILIITYILLNITIITIYYEFKKKKMAVYNLFGKDADEDIQLFLIYNAIIVAMTAIVVYKLFILLVIPEVITFYVLLNKKSSSGIATAIKGR